MLRTFTARAASMARTCPTLARAEAGEDAVAFIVESARRGKASGWCRPVR